MKNIDEFKKSEINKKNHVKIIGGLMPKKNVIETLTISTIPVGQELLPKKKVIE